MPLPAWVQTYRPQVGVPAALACAGSAYLAFSAESNWVRVAGATVAVLGAALFTAAWRGVAGEPALPRRWARWGRFAMLVLLSLAAFAGGLVGIAVLLGWRLAGRTEPLVLTWMYVGVLVMTAMLVVLATWWARSFVRIVRAAKPAWAVNVVVGLLVVAVTVGWLTAREAPGELDREGREQARQAGAGLYDLLLVIDPADPVGRDLILAARRERARGAPLFAGAATGSAYSIAYGLALAQPRRGSRALWRLVEPPTTDYAELTDSLARMPVDPRRRRASASYGRLLADTLVHDRVRWRANAQRGVAFLLAGLPALAGLDAGVAGAVSGDAIAANADPADACTRFLAGRAAQEPAGAPSAAVPWGDALAAHCERRRAQRAWEHDGRPAGEAPPPPVAVHVITGDQRRGRGTLWWTWARALDGRFDRPALALDGSIPPADAERLLRDARDVHLGLPVGDLADVVEWFRPHLYFDDDEEFFPVDADWMLSNPPGAERHEVCDHELLEDNCDPVRDAASLAGALDEYLDFAGGVRLGRDLVGRRDDPARMYVHVREERDDDAPGGEPGVRLYLGYWWFFSYNVSPWRAEVNCLPGFTFRSLSCHDHEGDWEGVTVVLRFRAGQTRPDPYGLDNLEPEAVHYEAHGHPIRWAWEDVELAADPGRYATHPVVYVAAGSHASYPARCRPDECTQQLAGSGLGEGGFDGGEPWRLNAAADCAREQPAGDGARIAPCLVALPATRDGRLGVLWNAFPGRWGKASCTLLAKVCAQVDGPQSPSLQARFRLPSRAAAGPVGDLRARRRADGQRTPAGVRRWPPGDGEPVPATPRLPAP